MVVIHTEREELKAYPATITFRDLMRKNRRRSVLLVASIVLIAVGLGGAAGALAGSAVGMEGLVISALLGCFVALLIASGASIWSWTSGDKAVLRMAKAIPVDRQADPELFNVVDELRLAAGIPMPSVYVIPTASLNAFATGRSPETASVAITAGLRQQLTRDELAGVIAHELAHIRHNDVKLMMLLATLVGVIVIACDVARESLWHVRVGGKSSSRDKGGGAVVVIALVVFILLIIISPILASMIQMAVSREREYLADAGAVELTRYPEGLASALQKLQKATTPYKSASKAMSHLFIVPPKGAAFTAKMGGMFRTHPPTEERIRRLLALMR
ncbi:MAG: M48 family metallopeptidase [Planctomycetota bacterium]|jgi:heat shock protein HtpX